MALTGYVSGLIIQSVPTKGNMKVESFTSSGTWTVPAGVTYAIATIRGGGGGIGWNSSPGAGGNSSVAFAAGTKTANGGVACSPTYGGSIGSGTASRAGADNSGNGATTFTTTFDSASSTVSVGGNSSGQNGSEVVHGGDVTAGASITITVGAGGTAGATVGAAGGSGFVYIEYLV